MGLKKFWHKSRFGWGQQGNNEEVQSKLLQVPFKKHKQKHKLVDDLPN